MIPIIIIIIIIIIITTFMFFSFGEPLFEHHHRVMLNSQRRFGSPWVGVQGDPPNHGRGLIGGARLRIPGLRLAQVRAIQGTSLIIVQKIIIWYSIHFRVLQFPLTCYKYESKLVYPKPETSYPHKTHTHTLKKGPEWVPIISKPFDRKTCV